MNEQQKIGALEAMLFAHADPVEAARLADALRVEPEETVRLLKKLQRKLDEEESGMAILYFDPDRWQMATRPYYGEMVKPPPQCPAFARRAGGVVSHCLQPACLPQLY